MSRALVVLLVVTLALAGVIALLQQPESEPPPQLAVSSPEPAPPPAPAAAPPAETEAASPARTYQLPRFDVVRVDPEGGTMLAGVAEPGAEVSVEADGAVVGTLRADRTGAFAGFVQLPTGNDAAGGVQRLDLAARRDDGPVRRSADPVLVGTRSDDAPEPAAPMVAIARAGGVDLLQQPGRDEADGVTLDIVSYDDSDTLVVSGRGNVLRLVRLYANATFVAETMVREDGTWEIAVASALPPGEHTLRVDEIAADGRVTSRVESPFRRTEPDSMALRPGEVMVERGQTLWQIAQAAYGNGLRFTVIYEANTDRISNPDLIYPGQILTVPAASSRP